MRSLAHGGTGASGQWRLCKRAVGFSSRARTAKLVAGLRIQAEARLNDDKVVDQDLKDRRVFMRFGEIESSVPFGIATCQATTVVRKVEIKPVQ